MASVMNHSTHAVGTATATSSSNTTGQRLSPRADPVLTNLFAIVLHCPCGILPFHGGAVASGRKFFRIQSSALPKPNDHTTLA